MSPPPLCLTWTPQQLLDHPPHTHTPLSWVRIWLFGSNKDLAFRRNTDILKENIAQPTVNSEFMTPVPALVPGPGVRL